MATKKITELDQSNGVSSDALLVCVTDPEGTPETVSISVGNFLGNVQANVIVSNTKTLSVNTVIIRNLQTPANSGITVTGGTLFYDSNYIYIAVANNTLKRVALSSF